MSWNDLLSLLGKRHNLRMGWRKAVRLPVNVIDDFKHQYPAELVEASPTGFRLRSINKLPKKKELILRFMTNVDSTEEMHGFAMSGTILDVPVEILWSRKEGYALLKVQSGGRFLAREEKEWRDLCSILLEKLGVDLAQGAEHRGHGRLKLEGELGSEEMIIRDVSMSGAGLLTRKPVPEASKMEISLGGEEHSFSAQCRVVRCVEVVPDALYHVGLAFEKMDRHTRYRLTVFLASILAENAPTKPAEKPAPRDRGPEALIASPRQKAQPADLQGPPQGL